MSAARDHQRFEPAHKGLNGPVLSLLEDREGVIWVGEEQGLRRVSNPSARALPEASVISIAEDNEGDLWAGTESQGITIVRNQKFVTFTMREGLADDAVRCVFQSPQGALAIGTNAGLTQLQNGRAKQLTTSNGLSSNVILSLGEDGNGNLLVGTPDGLNRVRPQRNLVDDIGRWVGRRFRALHLSG